MEKYRHHLVYSMHSLVMFMSELRVDVAHLLTEIGFAEEDKLHDNGEASFLDMDDFKSVDDGNVQEIIKLHDLAEEVYDSFTDINDISALDSMELYDEGVFDEEFGVMESWCMSDEKMFAMHTDVPRGYRCTIIEQGTFDSSYRQHLVKAVVTLEWYLQELYTVILNMVLNGSFAEVNIRLRGEEAICCDMTDFEGVDDRNVQELVKWYIVVENYRNLLCGKNTILEKEVLLFVRDAE